MAISKIKMCSTCAGAFEYDPETHPDPDTHSDVGEDCPHPYRE